MSATPPGASDLDKPLDDTKTDPAGAADPIDETDPADDKDLKGKGPLVSPAGQHQTNDEPTD